MKKISIIIVLLCITVGCASNINPNDKNILINSSNIGEESIDTLLSFEKELNKNGISFKKISGVEELDGALESYYYYFSDKDNPLVVYTFKEENSQYKKIVSDGFIQQNSDVDVKKAIMYAKNIIVEENTFIDEYEDIVSIIETLK